jgi:hypothetical protein
MSWVRPFVSAFALVAAVLGLAGCGAPARTSAAPPADLSVAENPALVEFTPESLAFIDRPIRSVVFELISDQEVHIGDSLDDVYKLLPRPRMAFPMTEVPPGLSSRFTVKGWESRLGAVGLIGSGGRLALYLEVLDQADEEAIRDKVQLAKRLHGEPTSIIERDEIRYWFWEDVQARKMISVAPDPQGRRTLASAMGHPEIMSALRMSPGLAEVDASAAVEVLRRTPASGS